MRLVVLLAALAFTTPVLAQSEGTPGAFTGITPFDPLTSQEFEPSVPFVLDDAFATQYNTPVPASATFNLPQHPGMYIQPVFAPGGGTIMAFYFLLDARDSADRMFLEDLQVVSLNIPMQPDAEDPVGARMVNAAQLLEQQVIPDWGARMQNIEFFGIEAVPLGSVQNAVQLVAAYVDPETNSNMLVRFVAMIHPEQEDGYFLVARINADLVAVTDPATLAASLTGRVLSSWQY